MQAERLSIGLKATLVAVFTITLLVANSYAASDKVLHSFAGGGKDGIEPYATLVFDASGNLYGTAYSNGTDGYGMVFELMPKAGGGWTEKVLHNFDDNGKDGLNPYCGLVFDSSGNLYGTTFLGGTYGAGTVFKLTPQTGGAWTETVLHSFNPSAGDGSNPYASVILDKAGTLYGTTVKGGAYSNGTVFELAPKAGGGWPETVLHSFNPGTGDGATPFGSLLLDKAGNLYGTTSAGGAYQYGAAFELTETASGWTETSLHSFDDDGADGYAPFTSLISDAHGNLYGTTLFGGIYNVGAVFELIPPKTGATWTEKVIHSFDDNGSGGDGPYAGLILDSSGNLYGTTFYGGAYGYGMVFELSPKAHGAWMETVLHNFNNNGEDGFQPFAGLTFDTAGNLYGTTVDGGAYTYGTVFEILP